MPFTNPSYFPTVRQVDRIVGQNAGSLQTGARVFLAGLNAGRNSAANDLVIIGSNSGSGGLPASFNGTTIVGSGSFPNATPTAVNATGLVILGSNTLPLLQGRFGDSVLVGNGIAALWALGNAASSRTSNVVIGNGALPTAIGHQAYAFSACTIIGHQAASGLDLGANGLVAIGNQSTFSALSGGPTGCVFIGSTTLGQAGATVQNVVVIGESASVISPSNNASASVIIGSSARGTGTRNVCIGHNARTPSNSGAVDSNDNVIIGYNGGPITPNAVGSMISIGPDTQNAALNLSAASGLFFIGNGTLARTLMWGSMTSGNLMFGHSLVAADRDLNTIAATNAVKILAGGRGAGNPANGGFFYFNAVDGLHFISPSGADTILAPI